MKTTNAKKVANEIILRISETLVLLNKANEMKRVQARYLQPGNILGGGETVVHVSGAGLNKKVIVTLTKNGFARSYEWNPTTLIGVKNQG